MPLKLCIHAIDRIGDDVECCKRFKQVPFLIFHSLTDVPEALKAIGFDINKAVIGPECPEKVNNDVEF